MSQNLPSTSYRLNIMDDQAFLSQAASSTLRRCRLYVDQRGEHVSPGPIHEKRPGWSLNWYWEEGLLPNEPNVSLSLASAEELLDALRSFAASRNVAVRLDAAGGRVVLNRPHCSVHGSEVCKTDQTWGVQCNIGLS